MRGNLYKLKTEKEAEREESKKASRSRAKREDN